MEENVMCVKLAEVAQMCRVQPGLLRQWIKQGVVPAARRGQWLVIAPETLSGLQARSR